MEKPLQDEEEIKELISNIHQNNLFRFFLFSGFILISLIVKFSGIGIPWLVIAIITLLLFTNLVCEYLAKKIWSKQTVDQASQGFFVFQVVEIIALLIIISYFDAVLFGGIGALMIYVMFCYLGFTRRIYPRIISFICAIGYIIIGLLEHLGITEYQDFYHSGVNLHQNRPLFIVTVTFMMGFFICFTFYGDFFSKKLRDTIENLRKKTKESIEKEGKLKEVKETLEIQVEARTRELKELAQDLDEQVKERTGELQEKIQELEKFQKLAVGRELKMIELKKEIEKLEKSQKFYKR